MPAIKTSEMKLTFNIQGLEAKVQRVINATNQMGASGTQAGSAISAGMNQARGSIEAAGQSATTNAVRFQTLTQGMLNLSTAGVQTFTSISNLDRAYNRAKASAIGLERATDLVNRKQFKLNQLISAGNASTAEASLLRNELATATGDLAVKEEKLKIEQEAVLDVQLLFAANIANVGVSSLQIFTTMIGAETAAMIKSTIATKLKTVSTWENLRASRASTVGTLSSVGSLGIQTTAMKLTTLATRLQTGALTALKIALGPVGLIFIGISAAMLAYETNALGLKDVINSLIGVEEKHTDIEKELLDTTIGLSDANNSLADSFSFKLPNSIAMATRMLHDYRIEAGLATIASKEVGTSISFHSKPSVPIDTSVAPIQPGFGNNLFKFLKDFGKSQQAFAESTPTITGLGLNGDLFDLSTFDFKPKHIQGAGNFIGGTTGDALKFTTDSTLVLGRMGIDPETFKALDRNGQFLQVFNRGIEPFLTKYISDRKFRFKVQAEILTAKGAIFENPDLKIINDMIKKAEEEDKKDIQFKSILFGFGGQFGQRRDSDIFGNFINLKFDSSGNEILKPLTKLEQQRILARVEGINVKKGILNGRLTAKQGFASTNLIRDLVKMRTSEIFRIIGVKKGEPVTRQQKLMLIGLQNLGASVIVTNDDLPIDTTGFSAQRTKVALTMGFDIGLTADSLPEEDAMRIGNLERILRSSASFGTSQKQLRDLGLITGGRTIFEFGFSEGSSGAGFNLAGGVTSVRRAQLSRGADVADAMNAINNVRNNAINSAIQIAAAPWIRFAQQNNLASNKGARLLGLGDGSVKGTNFFGDGFFNSTGATAAFQVARGSLGIFNSDEIKRADAFANSGGVQIAQIAAQIFSGGLISSLSRSGDIGFRRLVGDELSARANTLSFARAFGGDEISDKALSLAQEKFDQNPQSAREARNFLGRALDIADARINRVEKFVSSGLGIDFDANSTQGYWRYIVHAGGRRTGIFVSTAGNVTDQIRTDIGASSFIIIPTASKLEMITKAFNANGNFTNFNNLTIEGQSVGKLGLSEQQVFDIRFEHTRGDRELLNRLRHAERLQASSSGTSPL